ncbi:hypothetical protein LWI29_036700 [Acer saccharum]|uniref:Uncharacterized protein n=1 Tax=Acer saccharum TaxID=4024 RepID=A0AA39VQ97_ACESA|nr:hypothetical protein LWI29_036700 [Acer saccharum]
MLSKCPLKVFVPRIMLVWSCLMEIIFVILRPVPSEFYKTWSGGLVCCVDLSRGERDGSSRISIFPTCSKGIRDHGFGCGMSERPESTAVGSRRTTAKAFAKDVFINQERKLGARRRSDTVLVSTINDADQGSADVTFRTPLAPYEKSKSLGSGGSMVARLKLKGIDGRAPPGVEPAA